VAGEIQKRSPQRHRDIEKFIGYFTTEIRRARRKKAKMHKESLRAWLGYSALTLLMFAVVWFYAVFHVLLKIPVGLLRAPFGYLTVMLFLFAVCAKISRERLVNSRQVVPMIASVGGFFVLAMWGFGYFGGRLGFLHQDDVAFAYVVGPLLMLVTAIGIYYFGRQTILKIASKIKS
jgi:hypothetical protein